MKKFRLPWRTIMAIYGWSLLIGSLFTIAMKTLLMRDVGVDQATEALLGDRLAMNVSVSAVGAVLMALGIFLAIRKRGGRHASGPDGDPARKVET